MKYLMSRFGGLSLAILILLSGGKKKTGFESMKWPYLTNYTGGETRVNFRWGAN